MPTQYEIATALVNEYHADQMYGDKPYVYHLLGVTKLVTERGGDSTKQTVALLHDILEDTFCTAQRLREAGLCETIIEAVEAITHNKGEERKTYLRRCRKNPISREVKKCDTMFNLQSSFKENNSYRIQKYAEQLVFLENLKTKDKK